MGSITFTAVDAHEKMHLMTVIGLPALWRQNFKVQTALAHRDANLSINPLGVFVITAQPASWAQDLHIGRINLPPSALHSFFGLLLVA